MKTRRDVFLSCGMATIVTGLIFVVLLVVALNNCTNVLTGQSCTIDYGGIALLVLGFGVVATMFFLLSWRNSAGISAERRHREQLRATRGQRASVDTDAVILKRASSLWTEGKKSEALLLLKTIPDNPTAKRILQKANHTQ